MIALSAEIAEGLVFANASCAHMGESLGTLSAAKRGDPDFSIGNRIRTCISDDVDEARAVLRKTMAHYWAMPNYRNYWKEAGYLDEMTAAEAAIAEGRTDELPKYLSDRWLADCTLYGSAARIREGLRDVRMWAIWTIHPDGTYWEPFFSALGASGETARHFMTQLSDGSVVAEEYYFQENSGFGTYYKFPSHPKPGMAFFGSSKVGDADSTDPVTSLGR